MLDGIEQRGTGPAGRDDPAELDARLAALRAQIADRAGEPVGGRTVSARVAAQRLAARGTDPDTARGMVTDYLRDTSERVGAPAWEWGLDQGDIDAIAAAHQLPTVAREVIEQDATDTARRAELARGHTDDQSTEESAEESAGGLEGGFGGGTGSSR
jgi:hypothetical protein